MLRQNLSSGQAKSVSILTHLFYFVALYVLRSSAYVLSAAFVEHPGISSSVPLNARGNQAGSDLPRRTRSIQILYCFETGISNANEIATRLLFSSSRLLRNVIAIFEKGEKRMAIFRASASLRKLLRQV